MMRRQTTLSNATLWMSAVFCAALLLPAAARAEDEKTAEPPPVEAAAPDAPEAPAAEASAEAKPAAPCVRGRDLASADELQSHRSQMRAAASDEERARLMAEWMAELMKRADKGGQTLCHETGMKGMGRGMGMGPGVGGPPTPPPSD